MSRITRQQAQRAFENLCTAMGKTIAKNYNDVGAWQLDYVACYGGFNVEEIANEQGGVRQPFGSRRYKPTEFYELCWFAIRALEKTEKQTGL